MGASGPVDLSTTNFADLNLWKPLNSTNVVPQPIVTAALKAFKLDAGTSAAYYAVISRNDVRGDAEAFVNGTTLTATGDIKLAATESAEITAEDGSKVETSATESSSIGGLIVPNRVHIHANAVATG